jgi:hypothetical protein
MKKQWFGEELQKSLDAEIERAMKRTVTTVANRVRVLQTGPRTGKVYRIGKTPTKADRAAGRTFRSHQASAPGEPPAVWSGRLFRSVFEKVVPVFEKGRLAWRGYVGTNVQYAPHLEFGTKRMKPRPLWRRAVLECRQQIKEFWAQVNPRTSAKPGQKG